MRPAWFTFLWFLLPCLTSSAADDFLKFKQIHGQPLEARVQRVDLDQQEVTLVSRDGRTIVLSVLELNAVDKRLIVKSIERRLFQKPKIHPNENPPVIDQTVLERQRKRDDRPIEWHSSLKQATKSAQGDDADQDDRPIVWFRVLGDLRGLM